MPSSSSKRKKSGSSKQSQSQKRQKKGKGSQTPKKANQIDKSKPPKEERFAFLVSPPEFSSEEPMISRVLEEVSLHDIWLVQKCAGQAVGMIKTTNGEKYRWQRYGQKNSLIKEETLEFHDASHNTDTRCHGYLDEDGNVYIRTKESGAKKSKKWKKVQFPPGTAKIIDFIVSGRTFAALSISGQMFTWGVNDYGSLGIADQDERLKPELVAGLDDNISQIAGNNSMIAAVRGRRLFTWGSNINGMLGYDDNPNDKHASHYASHCLLAKKDSSVFLNVKQVCCGLTHVVALTKEGTVYAWGNGKDGQLGGNDLSFGSSRLPALVHINERIRSISCGTSGSLALSETGNVYAWGCKTLGESTKPRKLDLCFDIFEPVKVVCSGKTFLILARRKPFPLDHINVESLVIGGGILSQNDAKDDEGYYTSSYGENSSPADQYYSDTFEPDQPQNNIHTPVKEEVDFISSSSGTRTDEKSSQKSLPMPVNNTVSAFSRPSPQAPPQPEVIESMEVLPNGFTEVHGWLCGRLRALTAVDQKRYALNLVKKGFNSVGLLKEMLDPPLLAKCLQDESGNPLSQQHIHFKYICKKLKQEGLKEFS